MGFSNKSSKLHNFSHFMHGLSLDSFIGILVHKVRHTDRLSDIHDKVNEKTPCTGSHYHHPQWLKERNGTEAAPYT